MQYIIITFMQLAIWQAFQQYAFLQKYVGDFNLSIWNLCLMLIYLRFGCLDDIMGFWEFQVQPLLIQRGFTSSKSNTRTKYKICWKLTIKTRENIIDVAFVPLLLTFYRFHLLLWCFHGRIEQINSDCENVNVIL